MKIISCYFLVHVVFALKLSDDVDQCDRLGGFAEDKLHATYKALQLGKLHDGNISVFDASEIVGDGQIFYNHFMSNGVVCLDNWGYLGDQESQPDLRKPKNDSPQSSPCPWPLGDALGQNMYKFMMTDGLDEVNLNEKNVLEVGCGRGKGSAFVAQHMKPKSYMGVDLNSERINLANQFWGSTPNLNFKVGNALDLSQRENEMDIVLNVESSFHYPDFGKFLSEVHRVLKPKGLFLWTAPLFNRGDTFTKKVQAFTSAGFTILKAEDISKNIMKSRTTHLSTCEEEEFQFLCKSLHDLDSLWNWFGLKGSLGFDALSSGEMPYLHFIAQK